MKWRKLLYRSTFESSRRELSFQDLGINMRLTRMLRNKGIRNPTDIQQKAIQSLLAGKNGVINSETGSGKTLAYALPIANKIQEIKKKRMTIPRPYGLIVVPNMELQYQVSSVFSDIVGVNVSCANEDSPLKLLNTDVVVSTPIYLMTYALDVFRQVQTVVFDEADIMIAKKVGKHGHKDPLFNLIKRLLEPSHFQSFDNEDCKIDDIDSDLFKEDSCHEENYIDIFKDNRQFVFVGATMPDNEAPKSKVAMQYIRSWVPDISMIQSEKVHKVLSNIDMVSAKVSDGNKLKLLVQTLKNFSDLHKLRVLVFVNRYETATSLHHMLTKFNYTNRDTTHDSNFLYDLQKFHLEWEGNIHILHKNVKVNDRLEILHEFASSQRSLIITTDIVCRGLDLPDVDIVIQYEFATNIIDILHRAGRTGRMGKQGKVVNFISENDEKLSSLLEEAAKSGESLENLFSRRRGLSRKLRRSEKPDKELDSDSIENIC